MYQDDNRRYYLVQNLDAVESIILITDQSGGLGELIGPTGAKIVDMPTTSPLWARNPANANKVNVAVEEIIGYSPYEIRTLRALESMALRGAR